MGGLASQGEALPCPGVIGSGSSLLLSIQRNAADTPAGVPSAGWASKEGSTHQGGVRYVKKCRSGYEVPLLV